MKEILGEFNEAIERPGVATDFDTDFLIDPSRALGVAYMLRHWLERSNFSSRVAALQALSDALKEAGLEKLSNEIIM